MGPNINMPTEVEPISLVCERFHWLYDNSVIHKGRNLCHTYYNISPMRCFNLGDGF